MEILRCEHLCKQYGTGNACVKALDDVSFSVEKGEFVSLSAPRAAENPHFFIFWAEWTGPPAEKSLSTGQSFIL